MKKEKNENSKKIMKIKLMVYLNFIFLLKLKEKAL